MACDLGRKKRWDIQERERILGESQVGDWPGRCDGTETWDLSSGNQPHGKM